MTRKLLLALLLTPSALVLGCGADATVAPKNDGGIVDDSGNASDTGNGSDSGTPVPTKGGGVYLTSYAYTIANTPVAGMSASAGFYSAYGAATGCTTTTDGPCSISACTSGGGDAGGSPVSASAGTIQVTGGSKPVQLTPSGSTYTAVSGQTTLWSGGEQLEAIGAGAEVPAFDLKVTAPGYVTITVPTWPAAGGKVPITRTQPFAVAWTGGGAGNVVVGISATSGAQSTTLSCSFPASGGSGTVPATALGKLPAAAPTAGISITGSNVTEAVVSGWALRVNALTLAKTGTGVASAGVTIQ